MTDFKRILVATDFSPPAERALELAMEIGGTSGATITLFHASWLPPAAFAEYGAHAEGIDWHADDVARAAKKTLDDALARARAKYPSTDSAVAFGEPWRAILEAIAERGIDLVVMGTHGRRGLSHLVLGSVAEKIVRLSPVPVLTVTADAARATRDLMPEAR
jgi:nucleotide-binding universal stress UspA family protein